MISSAWARYQCLTDGKSYCLCHFQDCPSNFKLFPEINALTLLNLDTIVNFDSRSSTKIVCFINHIQFCSMVSPQEGVVQCSVPQIPGILYTWKLHQRNLVKRDGNRWYNLLACVTLLLLYYYVNFSDYG